MLTFSRPFPELVAALRDALLEAPNVAVGEWQAQIGTPMQLTAELEDVYFEIAIPLTQMGAVALIEPSMPWAEEHFQERVSGIPFNPPPSHERWPYRRANNAEHVNADGKFSHTYPERFWPKYVAVPVDTTKAIDQISEWPDPHPGLRFPFGDLSDVIEMLIQRRATRQAYLPIWFPEDAYAARVGERVPCSLGYHFMVRNDELSVRYFMRSCDFLRHFRDDVYMACRLAQHVAERTGTTVGRLVMHISSLHIFPPADTQLLQYRKSKGQ